MNPRLILPALALAAGLGAAAPKAGPTTTSSPLAALPPSPLVTRMKQIRATLDGTFKPRSESPLPEARTNPFRLPGASASAPAQPGAAPGQGPARPAESDAVRLRRLATSLTFGLLERAGSAPMFSIGSASYKEGDIFRLTDPLANAQVLLRIRKIEGRNVTFGLNNAEYTVTK